MSWFSQISNFIIELIASLIWPALIAWTLCKYRKEITHLVMNAKFRVRFPGGDGEYDSGRSLQETNPEKAREKTPILDREKIEAATPLIIHKYEKLFRERVQKLSEDSNMDNDTLIYRYSAETYLNLEFEKIYNIIWLSQVAFLKRLNELGGKANKDILTFYYDQAKEKWPEMYNEYSLEQWTNFLIAHQLIEIDLNEVRLTLEGSYFCIWITANQYNDPSKG